MHIFKTSADTYDSVLKNQKHAFKYKPVELYHGEIVILSKNKRGLSVNEKQISHYAIFDKIKKCNDKEIEQYWPGNKGRWYFITEFSEVNEIVSPFNLSEILPADRSKHYSSIMTHGKFKKEDENIIMPHIKRQKQVEYSQDLFPDEISDDKDIYEGAKITKTVNAYERDANARYKCIEHYGNNCSVCDINFKEEYGIIGLNYIHVHHLVPLSKIGKEYIVDPTKDLRPVCPNCHAMLHRNKPILSIEELRNILIKEREQNKR